MKKILIWILFIPTSLFIAFVTHAIVVFALKMLMPFEEACVFMGGFASSLVFFGSGIKFCPKPTIYIKWALIGIWVMVWVSSLVGGILLNDFVSMFSPIGMGVGIVPCLGANVEDFE
jgi:hypothetical protein